MVDLHIHSNDKLKGFVEEVRKVREGRHDCPSAEKNVSLPGTISKIIADNTYKNDYNSITALLLYETVSYDAVIDAARKIVDWLK